MNWRHERWCRRTDIHVPFGRCGYTVLEWERGPQGQVMMQAICNEPRAGKGLFCRCHELMRLECEVDLMSQGWSSLPEDYLGVDRGGLPWC